MSKRSQLSRLLSGKNQLGRIEKEEILEQVLSQVAAQRFGLEASW